MKCQSCMKEIPDMMGPFCNECLKKQSWWDWLEGDPGPVGTALVWGGALVCFIVILALGLPS